MPYMNRYQIAAANAYGGSGDFAHMAAIETEEDYKAALDTSGDTLFKHIMIELSDHEDCENLGDAVSRMESALRDIQTVVSALENLEPDPTPAP